MLLPQLRKHSSKWAFSVENKNSSEAKINTKQQDFFLQNAKFSILSSRCYENLKNQKNAAWKKQLKRIDIQMDAGFCVILWILHKKSSIS